MIKWKSVFEAEKAQFEKMSEQEKYVYFLLLQYRSPYLWGKELPTGADCSGSVCLALAAATGIVIRTTAEELYRKFFTVKNPEVNQIQAVFFLTQHDRRHGSRVARRGEVVHVAGVIYEGVVMNVVEPKADIRLSYSLRQSYILQDCDMMIRGLDRSALVSAKQAGSDLFGLDSEFGEYIGLEERTTEERDIW